MAIGTRAVLQRMIQSPLLVRIIDNMNLICSNDCIHESKRLDKAHFVNITCRDVMANASGRLVDGIIKVQYINEKSHVSRIKSSKIRLLQTSIKDSHLPRTDYCVHFVNIAFPANEITESWYNGYSKVIWLGIVTEHVHSIHANAFNCWAFQDLLYLWLHINNGALKVYDSVFYGVQNVMACRMQGKTVTLPAGMYDRISSTVKCIMHIGWPNDTNLNEMFANESFRVLRTLHIENVQMPQIKFRRLDATNFTAFRRLRKLVLIACGIQVIAERTFDQMSRTLILLKLNRNWIKVIKVDMFRRIFEAKMHTFRLRIDENSERLVCSCNLMEMDILLCPFQMHRDEMCVKCQSSNGYRVAGACALTKHVDLRKFCADLNITEIMRIVDVRLALHDDARRTLSIRTNFTSTFRMLFVDIDSMQMQTKCAQRASQTHAKCLRINRTIEHLRMDDWIELRGAEFVSITAIPFLYKFGARPMHLITATRTIGMSFWPFDSVQTQIVAASVTLGMCIGLVTGCFVMRIAYRMVIATEECPVAATTEQTEYYNEVDLNQNDVELDATPSNEYEYYEQFEGGPDVLANEYM